MDLVSPPLSCHDGARCPRRACCRVTRFVVNIVRGSTTYSRPLARRWFLASKGNEYFCEVDEEYILDRFNLTGLNAEVQGYSAALDLITDTAGASSPFLPLSSIRTS